MSPLPDTSASFLIRLKDHSDNTAWCEFVDIYRPMICRLAGQKGMQHADAEDLAQQVLLSVAGAIERWESDPQRARFRTWLRRVADNAILNAMTRRTADRGSGNSDVCDLLNECPDRSGTDSALLRLEFRRGLLYWAAQQVRDEFQAATWNAFWMTAAEGVTVDEAARKLNKTLGSVYAARSRVMRRLKEKIEQFEQDSFE
jgi:RNA polymerase sigma-70 factor (ECF subfamily)